MADEIPWDWGWLLMMAAQLLLGSTVLFSGRAGGWQRKVVAFGAIGLAGLTAVLLSTGWRIPWAVHAAVVGLGNVAAIGCGLFMRRPERKKDEQLLQELHEKQAQRRLLQNGITVVGQNVEMREAVRVSKQRNLRSQMNPHFLFNVLTGVQHLLIRDQREKALYIFQRFRHLLIQSLEVQHKVVGSIAEELNHVRQYIELELQRVSGPFDFAITCADDVDVERTPCPLLILQPLVENAIWHGLHGGRLEGGCIRIWVGWVGHELVLKVEDNGRPLDAASSAEFESNWGTWSDGRQKKEFKRDSKHESRALSILKERLKLFRHKGTFDLSENPDGHPFDSGMCAKIQLPFWRLQNLDDWREKEQNELTWLNNLKPEVRERYQALNREAHSAAREVETMVKKEMAQQKREAS